MLTRLGDCSGRLVPRLSAPVGFGLLLWCATGAPALAAQDRAPVIERTGLLPPTPAEEAWMRRHFPVLKRIRLNRIGLARINAARRRGGLPQIAEARVELAGLGEEMVFEDTPRPEGAASAESAIESTPLAVDNSASAAFPAIGNQGAIGSCASFATTYYQFTHEHALLRGWNAKSGDGSVVFSPKWTYNLINGGSDYGSSFAGNYYVLLDHGAANWAEFPYDSNYRAWCLNGDVWRHALEFRAQSQGTVPNSDADTFITNAKTQLANGHVLVIGTYVFSWAQKSVGDDPSTSEDDPYRNQKIAGYMKNTYSGPHGMTIVGCNDYIWCDLNGNGVAEAEEKGAFKIANSWGTGDWNSGFRWVCYDAVRVPSTVPATATWPPADRAGTNIFWGRNAYTLTARAMYTPKMVSRFTIRHAKRGDMAMCTGKGNVGSTSPSISDYPAGLTYEGGMYAFDGSSTACDGTFCLDLANVSPESGVLKRYFLGMDDFTLTTAAGQIKSMSLIDVWAGNQTVATITPAGNPGNFDPPDGIANGSTAWCWVDHTFNSLAAPPTVTVLATDAAAAELNTATGAFVVQRRDSSTGDPLTAGELAVNLSLGGTAANGVDYQSVPTAVSIPDGQSSVTLTVTPIQDTDVEGSETLDLTVAAGTGYLPSGSARLTLTDDDSRITVTATDATASEPGTDKGTFRFARGGGTDGPLTVYYGLSGTATPGSDYAALSGSVSFGNGATQADVTVTPYDDLAVEPDETVTVSITPNAAYAVGSPGSATVTILASDNQAPVVSINDPAAARVYAAYFPCQVVLEATVTDDGYPAPASVSCAWSKLSGPETLSFGETVKEGVASPYTVRSTVAFTASGTYALRLSANDGWAQGSKDVTVVVLAPGAAEGGLNATYWNNSDFSGTSVSRVDSQIQFNWGSGSPDAAIGADSFSARWTGKVKPQYTETYTFYTYTDDGARLWVDNQLLVDQWVNQSATEWSGAVALTAGVEYDLKMEYYENTGSAVAELRWSSPSTPKAVIPSTALNTGALPANYAPFVDAGPNRQTNPAVPIFLDATVTDDGQAEADPVLEWSKLSGPGTVTFGDANAEDTTATFGAPGQYVLRLTADDGEVTTYDELTVTVDPPVLGVSSVTPGSGRMGGHRPPDFPAPATITGNGFVAGATVEFISAWQAQPASGVVVAGGTTIYCETPPQIAGPVDVKVTIPGPLSHTLPGAYTYTGWEGDVAPRAALGDEGLSADDLIQMRRFVAGLETVASGPEFQRTDVAPRGILGDGSLLAADLIQLRRYVAGLDPSAGAGGPAQPASQGATGK